MKPTPAGSRRQFITIQQNTTAADSSYGGATPDWSQFAQAYASIKQLSGRELFNAQQVVALATHEVNLRYVPGVVPEMQILIEGIATPLQILDVNDVEFRHRELVLLCVQKK